MVLELMPWESSQWGVTAREARGHESLARRLARELPDDRDQVGRVMIVRFTSLRREWL